VMWTVTLTTLLGREVRIEVWASTVLSAAL
jgi:hypothetical protein